MSLPSGSLSLEIEPGHLKTRLLWLWPGVAFAWGGQPASKAHLDLEYSLLSPGCHPDHHARLQKLFRYVFPAVHFNSAEVSGTRMELVQPGSTGVSGAP